MKTRLDHLSEAKREQLERITALLKAEAPVERVILFGSHARGDWVEDHETLYFSDYDLLAVVDGPKIAEDLSFWNRIEARLHPLAGNTPLTLLVHDFENHENSSLEDGA